MIQKKLWHPVVIVDVHIDQTRNDKFAGGVDDRGVFRIRGRVDCVLLGDSLNCIAFNDEDGFGQSICSAAINEGRACDDGDWRLLGAEGWEGPSRCLCTGQ